MKRPEEEVRQKTTNKTAARKEHQIRPRAAAEEKHDPSAAQAWDGPAPRRPSADNDVQTARWTQQASEVSGKLRLSPGIPLLL